MFHLAIELTSNCRRDGGASGWFAGAPPVYVSAWADEGVSPFCAGYLLGGLFWLSEGGLAYTLGAVFFLLARIRYFHFAWHLFVVAGTACHMVAVVAYSG